ncbi:IclR family transcriptional regulator [Allopusillimonas soli]|uniref:IclR family transcriptional regulator n=1 Tax=Allopusillimonas soli TaxID=659016 RepID=A0A853F603_9BURK|nr:IclR family transcriptional regulator [Allopusillimonas soli]NYT35974.1 IclR family transcriptional regulator [Allopusillimonas soli]TEA76319.1 IclR family transcriptional regulator [Allopusillimonas soli]
MNKPMRAGVQSVENGLDLILVVAHHRRPMKITDIADMAGISPSKAHRYLVSFMRTGFIAQDPETGLYGMGPVALEFSLSCLATIEPISIATVEAGRLCRAVGHTVAISVWGSFGPTVVRWEQPNRPVMVNVGLGSVFPLYRSATGRIFAAFMDAEAVRNYLDSAASLDRRESGKETVEQVRRRGLARAEGDFMSGMSAFAAPVYDDRGRLALAMTVLDYKTNFDHRWRGRTANALRESAANVSRALGWRGNA